MPRPPIHRGPREAPNTRGRRLGAVLLGILAAAVATSAAAQVPPPVIPPSDPAIVEPPRQLDPGLEDVGPLSTSLRVLDWGLPGGDEFDRVYQVPGRPELLMRVSGGLHAVFPRSTYAGTDLGPVPTVPAGTIFYIGDPVDEEGALELESVEDWPGRVSLRVTPERLRAEAEHERTGRATTLFRQNPIDSIAREGPYRRQRLTELLGRAAEAR